MDIHCFANGERNGASFRESSEEEIVAINEAAFFIYPSDTSRLGIYPPLFTSPSGDSCILVSSYLSTM